MIPEPAAKALRPWIIGHRGAAGHARENSREAFRIAADATHIGRCDGVELDIHCTADGGFVVQHDGVVPTGEPIEHLSTDQVLAISRASKFTPLLLAEALDVLDGCVAWIEIKQLPPAFDERLLDTIRFRSRGTCRLHAFDHRVVARLHRRDPSIGVGVLSRSYPIDPVRQVTDAGATALWQEAWLVDQPLIDACHAASIDVIAWTVNDPPEIERLVRLGVDGLCGDWPERIRAGTMRR